MLSLIRRWRIVLQFIPQYAWRPLSRFIIRPVLRVIRRGTRWDGFWWIVAVVAVLVAGAFLSWRFWENLHGAQDSISTTVRNVGLVIGGIVAIILAVWRSIVAEHQSHTGQRGLLNERYQKGAEMLGSEVMAVRLGGIYALERLAAEHPDIYHIQIMKLFCSYVRNPNMSNDEGSEPALITDSRDKEGRRHEGTQMREDIQTVMAAIGGRGEIGIAIERTEEFTLDLHGADLSFGRLSGANLAGADLSLANLRHVSFFDTTPSGPDLSTPIPSGPNQPPARIGIPGSFIPLDFVGVESRRANLSGSILNGADLSHAFLLGADLSGAQLVEATLSNSQLIRANLRQAVLLSADLSGAFLLNADLAGAQLAHANLVDTQLPGAKLYGANLFLTELHGADLSGAVFPEIDEGVITTGLTQAQIDEARASPNDPPILTGIVDYSSGDLLVWRGRLCGE